MIYENEIRLSHDEEAVANKTDSEEIKVPESENVDENKNSVYDPNPEDQDQQNDSQPEIASNLGSMHNDLNEHKDKNEESNNLVDEPVRNEGEGEGSHKQDEEEPKEDYKPEFLEQEYDPELSHPKSS
jgi:hypothetical protein